MQGYIFLTSISLSYMPSHYCTESVSLLQNEKKFETHANLNASFKTDFQLLKCDSHKGN